MLSGPLQRGPTYSAKPTTDNFDTADAALIKIAVQLLLSLISVTK